MSVRILAPAVLLLFTTGCWPFIWELQQTSSVTGTDTGAFLESAFVIDEPFDGQGFPSGAEIAFGGHYQSSQPPGAFVEWSSSLDGYLFEGEYGYAYLSDGNHEITATSRTTNGEQSTAVTISVGGSIDPPDSPVVSGIDLVHIILDARYDLSTEDSQDQCGRDDCSCRASLTAHGLAPTEWSENQLTLHGDTWVSLGDCDPTEIGLWYPSTGTAYHTLNSSDGFDTINSWVVHEASEPEAFGATPNQLGTLILGTSFCAGCGQLDRNVTVGSPPSEIELTLSALWNNNESHISEAPDSAGELLITEFMIFPDEATGPWLELHNPTSETLSLYGCEVGNGAGDAIVPGPILLAPGGYFTLGESADSTAYPDVSWGYLPFGGVPDGIVVNCRDLDDPSVFHLIDAVGWSDASWWLPSGQSLQLDPSMMSFTENDAATAWCASTQPYGPSDRGTPGSANPTCP